MCAAGRPLAATRSMRSRRGESVPIPYDAATLLHWTVTDRQYGVRCSAAMRRINDYLVGARNQSRRIKRSIERVDRIASDTEKFGISRSSWHAALRQAFIDIHFYFVCWDTIRKMIELLKDRSDFRAVREVYKCHRRILKHYGEARNHLEHYKERLEGRKKSENLANPWDMGNLEGYVYTLNREKYDVGPDSLKQLEKIVSKLNQKILQEAIPKYQKILEEDR